MIKRTIIVFGNCQAQLIVACLKDIPALLDGYEIIWVQNADNPAWGPRVEMTQSRLANCDFLFEQQGRKHNEFTHKQLLPNNCTVIRLPYLKLMCLWPFTAADPRNKPEPPRYGGGRFPYGDKIVINKIQANVASEVIFADYMKMDIQDHVSLDDMYEADMDRIRMVDEKCDIRIYDLILSNFRTKRLFNPSSTVRKK